MSSQDEVRVAVLGCSEMIRERVKRGEKIDRVVNDIQRKVIRAQGNKFREAVDAATEPEEDPGDRPAS